MKTLIKTLVCLVLAANAYSDTKPKVLVSIQPLALIAQDLLAGLAEVERLLPANADPHHYSLRISDRQLLADADLIIWLGPRFEQFLSKPMGSIDENKRLSLIDTNAGIADPHIWLDPKQAIEITQSIAEVFARLHPSKQEQLNANLQRRLIDLENMAQTLQQNLAQRFRDTAFVADHPAYQALISAYDLQQVGVFKQQENIAPSARHLVALTAVIEQEKPHCILAVQTNAGLQRWAQRWQLPIVIVDILGQSETVTSYSDLMRGVVGSLTQCFQRN